MMRELGWWKTLTPDSSSDELVLAVDFDTTGRPEARFSDLVTNLQTDLSIWESVPPPAGTPAAESAAGYIDLWAGSIEQEKPRVRALLGFCAGSVYAAALAERIAAIQDDAPLLLLFDPEITVSQTLMWQFYKVMGFMSGTISDAEVAQAREAGQRVHDQSSEIVALKRDLVALVRRIGEPAFTRVGLDSARQDELFSVFEAFMSYLAAASEINPIERWRTATAFSSMSALSGLRGMRSSGIEGVDQISLAQEIEIDTDHGNMLANKGLARLVSEILNR
jgi:hypothetical protein